METDFYLFIQGPNKITQIQKSLQTRIKPTQFQLCPYLFLNDSTTILLKPMHLYRKLIPPCLSSNLLTKKQLSHTKTSKFPSTHLKYHFSSSGQADSSKKTFPTFSELECKQLITQPNPLKDIILEKIILQGQMKLQKYWNLALTDSQFGYYRQQNVFSKEGDFTTSPEISPLFGEMIAVWIAYFLGRTGVYDQGNKTVTKKFRLVELGPGRGLLMRDIIKSLHEIKIDNHFDISFIEVSQYNRKCQQDNLFEQFKKYDKFFRFEFQNENKQVESFKNENEFQDINLKWYPNLELLVKEDYEKIQAKNQLPLTVFVMNEFFDALPTTILEYTEQGWREKIIGKSMDPELPLELKNSTRQLHQKFTPKVQDPKIGDRIQVSHQSLITMDTMAKLLINTKGAILNIDYGAQSAFSNSIRAIKQHKFIPSPYFWQIPGKCDLSAYVNFAALAQFAQANTGIKAFQAIPQGFFLEAMGINPRIEILQKYMNQKEKEKLESEYQRLTHPEQMGENFKVQCITLKHYGELYPWITEKEGVY